MVSEFNKIKYSINIFEKKILTKFLTLANPKVAIELGIDKGSTTRYILEHIKKNSLKAKLYGFDFAEKIEKFERSDESLKNYIDNDYLQFIKGRLPESLDTFLSKKKPIIDFVFIDATGDFKNVYGELSLIWPYLSLNGYIICHYHKERLHYAVEYFSKKNNAKFLPVFRSYSNTKVYASIAILAKPQFNYNLFKRLYYQFELDQLKGYYFFKRLLNKFK
jgi:hypothetical protein